MDFVTVSLVLFACALIQVTSGFGFALLAMPLVTLILGFEQAAPLVAAAGLLVNSLNAIRLHRHINRAALVRLGLAALLGILPGFWLQDHVPGYSIVKADSLEEATRVAAKCPHLAANGTVTVYETFPVM